MFIISFINDQGEMGYYATDDMGYPYCTDFFSEAKQFHNTVDAIAELEKDDFTKTCTTTNGTIFPPGIIQSAAGICYNRMKGSVEFQIIEIEMKVVETKMFHGEIVEP